MMFIYGAPTCGKTFAITKLATGGREWPDPNFPSLREIVETARKLGFSYRDHLLLDTDWLFPTVIRKFADVANVHEAWEYWRSTHLPAIEHDVARQFATLRIPKCLVFTNLAMWNYGIDVPLRYARARQDIWPAVQARDALKGRKRSFPQWINRYTPPRGSVLLPLGEYIYPRIIEDLAEVSPAFARSKPIPFSHTLTN